MDRRSRHHPPPTPAPLDAAALARATAAYQHAARRALRGPVLTEIALDGGARSADAYAEAMEALHTLTVRAPTQRLRTAAAHALGLARGRLYGAHGHPVYADDAGIRPGRGVWLERRGDDGRLVTVPATVVAVDPESGRACVALEADEHRQIWTPAAALVPREAGVSHLPIRTASVTTA